MKKAFVFAAFVAFVASPVMAAFQAKSTSFTTTLRGFGVGAFAFEVKDKANWQAAGVAANYSGTNGTFMTFCVEGQLFNLNKWYDATIDNTIMYDGIEHAPSPVTKSAYAYYRANAFTDAVDTASENRALQALLWDLEGVEVAGGYANAGYQKDNYSSLSAAEKTYYTSYYTQAQVTHAWASLVKVMNLWDVGNAYNASYDRQSHLVLMVPAPGAAFLVAVGIGLVGWAKRRFA